jgi:hypothetical protein
MLYKLVEELCLLKASMKASLHIYDPWNLEDRGADSFIKKGIIYQDSIISTKGCPR